MACLDKLGALVELGKTLREEGKLQEAEATFRTAIAFAPCSAEAHKHLATILADDGRIQEARAALDLALTLRPDDPQTRLSRAQILLLQGDYRVGWKEYEWRFSTPHAQAEMRYQSERRVACERQVINAPRWRGEPLHGRTILLYGEQGHGDVIQFARYAPLVAKHRCCVVLEVYPTLVQLLESLSGVFKVVQQGSELPSVDFQCPLLSLPQVFDTTLKTIPCEVPYVTAPTRMLQRWACRLPQIRGLRIGIVWAGSSRHRNDLRRSIPFGLLEPLWRLPDLRWVSLQVGSRAHDLKAAPSRALEDLMPELGDFAETAAAIAQLDLVVSVDTAVAHLAGAMGVPVWLLLPFAPDWRWLNHGETSRWYPTMRLFRQDRRRSWSPVIQAVAKSLRTLRLSRRRKRPD
jgi:hypothetical protein